jgi:hypothetical protein
VKERVSLWVNLLSRTSKHKIHSIDIWRPP